MRINQPGSQADFLVDFTQGVSYTIDHHKKLIQKMSWDDLEIAAEASMEKLRKLPPLVLTLMGVNDVTVTVEERGSEIFLGRECRRWRITMGPMVIESSNDPSVDPPVPAIPYQRFLRLHTALGQLPSNAALARKAGEELSKVQGIALNYRIALPLAGQLTMTTTRLEEGPIPPSAFDLPVDYQVEDTGKKLRENLVAIGPSGSGRPVAERQVRSCSGI
ncbi:MAG: hypothetical protein HXX12_16220 [Geothrix sp.]|uniref:hypothetical protein n=1 Tax=Geothrix sp. TaxID=1962974 RepID=UPI00180580CC|nr:hypothetical protein [Geothrix sp.]NWJ42508.1 hypothetical protein [Geothrix sp.]WIL19530.1 MAG: hypothetical protein QOZ81_002050 [Geothrix sp.]